jgi:hypothetical protein
VSIQKQDHPSIMLCAVGVSGTGKTTLYEKIVRRAMRSAKWVFFYDHKDGDFSRRFGIAPCLTPDDLLAALEKPGGVVIFNPCEMFPGEAEAGFLWFCKFVWEVGKNLPGVKIVGADELEAICSERCKPRELCKILDMGRTFQFDCYFVAQSMNGLHNQVRKQIKELFAFRQGDANGTRWLMEKGFDGRQLETLKNGVWHYKNFTTGETQTGGKAFEPRGATRDLRGL